MSVIETQREEISRTSSGERAFAVSASNGSNQTIDSKVPTGAPLAPASVPLDEIPQWNFYYLNTCAAPQDPTIVWGTDVDCTVLQAFLKERNRESDVLLTPAHVLVAATGRAMAAHPQFNRRILRKRVWEFRSISAVMPFRSRVTGQVDVMFLGNIDERSLEDVAGELWRSARQEPGTSPAVPNPLYLKLPRWFLKRIQPVHVWMINTLNLKLKRANHRQRAAAVMVNFLGDRGMAPLRSFKPSRLPYDSMTVSVTMGSLEQRPVVHEGEVVVRTVAPIVVRADHRIVDAHEIGAFAQTLRELISDPYTWNDVPCDSVELDGAGGDPAIPKKPR